MNNIYDFIMSIDLYHPKKDITLIPYRERFSVNVGKGIMHVTFNDGGHRRNDIEGHIEYNILTDEPRVKTVVDMYEQYYLPEAFASRYLVCSDNKYRPGSNIKHIELNNLSDYEKEFDGPLNYEKIHE